MIIKNYQPIKSEVGDLEQGDTFEAGGALYVKIDTDNTEVLPHNEDYTWVFNIAGNYCVELSNTCQITLRDMEVHIK